MEAFFLIFGCALLTGLYFHNKKRAQNEIPYELVPNQLLTRHPVLFISGSRSPFYFIKFWNQIPSYLAEHGYEVYNLDLPWKITARSKELTKVLQAGFGGQRFHLFIDASNERILGRILLRQSFENIESITIVRAEGESKSFLQSLKPSSTPIEEIELKPAPRSRLDQILWTAHRAWTFEPSKTDSTALGWPFSLEAGKAILDRARILAERDHFRG